MLYRIETLSNMQDSVKDIQDKVSGVLGFAINYNRKNIKSIMDDFENLKNELVVKYHDKEIDGVYYLNSEEAVQKATAELKQLADVDFNVDIIKIPDILFIHSKLTAKEIAALDWMVEPAEFEAVTAAVNEKIKEEVKEITSPKEESDLQQVTVTLDASMLEHVPYDPKEPVEDPRFV